MAHFHQRELSVGFIHHDIYGAKLADELAEVVLREMPNVDWVRHGNTIWTREGFHIVGPVGQ